MSVRKQIPDDKLSKFQRYRISQSKRGLKLLRVWVPDPARPEFAKEAKRQAMLLRKRPDEQEALRFINAAFAWPDA
jgi:Protein  of unknown function (DUF3018)